MAGAGVASDTGTGRPVVLLHGVGVEPTSLDAAAGILAAEHRVVVLERPRPRSAELAAQADAVAAALGALGAGPAVLAGISGGATLSLAVAARHPGAVAAAVVHEPLMGTHAPELHQRVRDGLTALAGGWLEPSAWFRRLVGEWSWARLPHGVDGAGISADEVAPFVQWTPTGSDLAALARIPLVTTVGARSDPSRHDAARRLGCLTGARVVELPGVGHLPQFDDPGAFARIVVALAAELDP